MYLWPIERVRHVPSLVRFTSTETPACIVDILDRILTVLYILLLCTFDFVLSFINHLTLLFLIIYQGATIGRLFDAYGPTWLMTAGTFCCAISTITTSFCREYYQYILSQGILFGLGVGLLYVHS